MSRFQDSAQHTPGPWSVCTDDATSVRDDEGSLIADCRRFQYTDDGEIDLPDNEANARLIAAAPELLAALERLIVFAEAAETKALVGDEGCLWPVEEARAAIAKATGA